jgi:glutamate synthase (ferredoxin)
LAELIYELRAINPAARIGVKLVSTCGIGIIAAGVAKAGADVITISGHDGGTGASPLTSIKNTGVPWEIGLRESHERLIAAGLRNRVRLRVDGGLKFARDVIVAALLGADEFGFGSAALIAIGCVMARQCHLNTCPVGIATQDEKLRLRFTGKPEMVEQYFRGLAAEVRQTLSEIGVTSIADIVGQVDRLRPRSPEHEKVVAPLLRPTLDWIRQEQSPAATKPATSCVIPSPTAYLARFPISNRDRAVGAHYTGELLRRHRAGAHSRERLFEFSGIAGQSFGAFLTSHSTFHLYGEANDYVGKGLSGGAIRVTAGQEASLRGDVLAGNAVLYGATSGELYLAGRVGERFAVRNSGALGVVEGVGLHGCEYMTGGIVVVLGPAGTNFGAGMTGGLAYCRREIVGGSINDQCVTVAEISELEIDWMREVLQRHLQFTDSPVAASVLEHDMAALVRIEPVQPACTVAEAWSRIPIGMRATDIAAPVAVPRSLVYDGIVAGLPIAAASPSNQTPLANS